jgi:hypothetical protein
MTTDAHPGETASFYCAESLRISRQEWTALAIDFVLVVVDVFLGIRVLNWNAVRVDEGRA